MTADDWERSENVGRMLQHLKRACRLGPVAKARKFRPAGLAFVRDLPGWDADPRVAAVVSAVEGLCDGRRSLAEVSAAVRSAGFPIRCDNDDYPDWGSIVRSLGGQDGYDAAVGVAGPSPTLLRLRGPLWDGRAGRQAAAIRDIFGNPFRPVTFRPEWRTAAAVGLAAAMYGSRDFGRLPVLADALEEAGCDHPDALTHCRQLGGVHVRGCWVVDGVLGQG